MQGKNKERPQLRVIVEVSEYIATIIIAYALKRHETVDNQTQFVKRIRETMTMYGETIEAAEVEVAEYYDEAKAIVEKYYHQVIKHNRHESKKRKNFY
jgi:hypothetical protein